MPHAFQTRRFVTALFGILMTAASGAAQTSDHPFNELSRYLDFDDTVYVTGRTTGEIRGRHIAISSNELTITTANGPARIASRDVAWIEKRGDPVRNGALVGAGLSSILFAGAAGASCSECGRDMTIAALAGVAIGGGFGAAIDWLHPGRTLVYGARPESVHGRRTDPPIDVVGRLWSEIRPGDDVSVRRRGGGTLRGRFVRVDDTALVIDSGGRHMPVVTQDIDAVVRHGSYLGHGLVIGPTVGAALFAATALDSGSSGAETVFAGTIGGISGLAWGAAIGRLVPRRIPAYHAPSQTVRFTPLLLRGQRGATVSVRY